MVVRTVNILEQDKVSESLEDANDAKVADISLVEYENYLQSGGEALNWEDTMSELELNVKS